MKTVSPLLAHSYLALYEYSHMNIPKRYHISSSTGRRYITFLHVLSDESLSSRQKTSLKWKPSTITPNVIKHTLAKVGFTYITS